MSVAPSRRSFLLGSSMAAVSISLAGTLASCSDGSGNPGATALELWTRETGQNGARQQLINDRLSQFDDEHGTSSSAQFLGFDDSIQKTQAALAAGNPPDVGQQGPDVTLGFAAAGNLLDISDLFDEISPRLLELEKDAYVEYEGRRFGIPWYLETRVLFYHKDLLDAEGLQPPTTWQEWKDVAAATRQGEDQYGFMLGPEGAAPGQLFIPLATSAGASLIAADGSVSADTDEHREALQLLLDLYHSSMPASLPTFKNNDLTQLFAAKKCAMLWTNYETISAAFEVDPALRDSVGAVLTPVRSTSDVSRSFLGGWQLFAFAEAGNHELSTELIRYLLEPEWYQEYIEFAGGAALPVTAEAAALPMFADDEVLATLVTQLETAVRYGGTEYGNAPYLGEVEGNGMFSRAVIDTFTGSQSVDQAVLRLDADLKQAAGQ